MTPLTIFPYRLSDTWVFDDLRTGLKEEAFVAGSDVRNPESQSGLVLRP